MMSRFSLVAAVLVCGFPLSSIAQEQTAPQIIGALDKATSVEDATPLVASLETFAGSGDVQAMRALGRLYRDGKFGFSDPAKAIAYFEQAAATGNIGALLELGALFAASNGPVPKDAEKSLGYFTKAAAAGSADGKRSVALAMLTGDGTAKDVQGALAMLDEVAKAGDVQSMMQLGRIYYYGVGVQQDIPKAIDFYLQAEKAGNTVAKFQLGQIYRGADNPTGQDFEKAFGYFQQAASAGFQPAQRAVALALLSGEGTEADPVAGVLALRKLIAEGDSQSMLRLAAFFTNGKGTSPDTDQAVMLYEKAAEAGNSGALVFLGDLYSGSKGLLPADPARAIEYYRRAAQAGNAAGARAVALAQISGAGVAQDTAAGLATLEGLVASGDIGSMMQLARRYLAGDGVPGDVTKAIALYERAVESGNISAMIQLGNLYRQADGPVPQDMERANRYLSRAAQSGVVDAERAYAFAILDEAGNREQELEAAQTLEGLADQGDIRSIMRVALMYLNGEVFEANPARSAALYEKAAEAGNLGALMQLGTIYRRGAGGLAADPARSFGYFERAAKAGLQPAIRAVALARLNGEGTPKDAAAGFGSLRELADQGDVGSLNNLALAQYWGWFGTKPDPKAALAMLEEKSAGGSAAATRLLISFYRDAPGKRIPRSVDKAREVLRARAGQFSPEELQAEDVSFLALSASRQSEFQELASRFTTLPAAEKQRVLQPMVRSNANAYVYIVQDFLQSQKIYSGPLNGTLTTATIRAIGQFCGTAPEARTCSLGPLSGPAVRFMVGAISAKS